MVKAYSKAGKDDPAWCTHSRHCPRYGVRGADSLVARHGDVDDWTVR